MDFDDVFQMSVEQLCFWLQTQKLEKHCIDILKGAGIDGQTFLTLSDRDLKDLFEDFLSRKNIRGIQTSLSKEDIETTPAKKPRTMQAVQSCSPQLLQVQHTPEEEHATLFVPQISILSSPEEYSQKEIDDARKRLIRICMDHLCTQSGRRPTEAELHDLARAIANKYNSLRDNPALGVRQNYTGIIGFLRRRMYNSTPSVSNRGRKPAIKCNKKAQMVREDSFSTSSGSSCMEASSEEETSGVHKAGRLQHPQGSISQSCSFQKVDNCKDSLTGEKPPDRAQEAIDNDLSKCSENASPERIKQLLRLSFDARRKKIENLKVRRVEEINKMYPCFKKPCYLKDELFLILPHVSNEDTVRGNLIKISANILDYLYDNNMIKIARSTILNEELQILVAFSYLPLVVQSSSVKGKAAAHHVVHIVKTAETWQSVASAHKNNPTPWIMVHHQDDSNSIMLMYKDQPVGKAEDSTDAVLTLMGFYYTYLLGYPQIAYGALLYIQKEVLQDNVHEKDAVLLEKSSKNLLSFLSERQGNFQTIFD